MKRWMLIAALTCASSLAAAAFAEPVKTGFELVGTHFDVTLPEGFCPAEGPAATVAETLAKIDTSNQTDLSFFECSTLKPGGQIGRYGAIKTPKATLIALLPPRKELLAQLAAGIKDGSIAQAMQKADVAGQVNKASQDTLGLKLNLSIEPKLIDTDDKAAYMIGVLSGGADGEPKSKVAMAAAITEVKGRVMSWYRFGPYTSDNDVAALLKDVKVDIARFIADNGG